MDPTLTRPRPRRRGRLRRAVLARRRVLAAVAAGFAVVVGLQAAAPPPVATRTVLTAARDLPAGAVLDPGDLTRSAFLPGTVPAGALTEASEVVGRTTTGPVHAGEALTDVRLVSGSLLDGYPGRVAVPVRVADPGAVALLRVGDLVEVIAADPQGRSEAVVVASEAPVLAVPQATEGALASGGLVVLAVTDETARALAAAAVSGYLSLAITH
ncbi:MAG TPA: Flp pilus assembly protein CpaB [Nocardioidaceae bacterium]